MGGPRPGALPMAGKEKRPGLSRPHGPRSDNEGAGLVFHWPHAWAVLRAGNNTSPMTALGPSWADRRAGVPGLPWLWQARQGCRN